jgi:hypothetical protein
MVVNSPRFTTHSTTNSPRFTTTLHHKICKTPCKNSTRHAEKNIRSNGHGFGRVIQSSGCRIGKVRCNSGIFGSGFRVFQSSAYSGRL